MGEAFKGIDFRLRKFSGREGARSSPSFRSSRTNRHRRGAVRHGRGAGRAGAAAGEDPGAQAGDDAGVADGEDEVGLKPSLQCNPPRDEPGGFGAISRWLRRKAPTPPDPERMKFRIPAGCQPLGPARAKRGHPIGLRSLRDRPRSSPHIRGCRFAQPPANGWYPSGMAGLRSLRDRPRSSPPVRGCRFAQPPANGGHPSGMAGPVDTLAPPKSTTPSGA